MPFTAVDLSALPPPSVIETVDYEAILAEMKEAVAAIHPGMAPVLQIETEPAVKVLEVCAAFVMMTRARVNDAARAVLLAFATGTDLDNLAALVGVTRKVITPATDTAPAVMEGDAEFRARVQLAFEGFSVAGPRDAYRFHAISAHADVRDVYVAGPGEPGYSVPPGEVRVFLLGRAGNGAVAPAVIAAVQNALSAETIRPLCDTVVVSQALISEYAVTATLHMQQNGPSAELVLAAARAALADYLASTHKIGATVAISGIHAALHQAGVERVTITSPAADIAGRPNVAPFATSTNISASG